MNKLSNIIHIYKIYNNRSKSVNEIDKMKLKPYNKIKKKNISHISSLSTTITKKSKENINKNIINYYNVISLKERKKIRLINKQFFNLENYYNHYKFSKTFKLKPINLSYCQNFNDLRIENQNKTKSKNNKIFSLKKNNTIKMNQSMTLMFKKKKPKENLFKRLLNSNNQNQFPSLIKAQNIKWLWKNKSSIIETFIVYYKKYQWFFEKNKLITKERLIEFMHLINNAEDEIFLDNIFLLFDFENNNTIDFSKMLFNFIITGNYSYEKKIKLVLSLVVNNKNKLINIKNLLELLVYTINLKERKKIFEYIKEELKTKENNIIIQLNKIYDILLNNKKIKTIFKKYFINYYDLKEEVEKEIEKISYNCSRNILKSSQNISCISKSQIIKMNSILKNLQKYENLKEKNKKENNFNDFEEYNFYY